MKYSVLIALLGFAAGDALKEQSSYVSQSHRSNFQQKLIKAATGPRPQDLSEHEESVTLEKPGPMMASKQKLISLATSAQPRTDALKEASTYVSQSHRSNFQQKLIRAATGTRPQDLSEHEESVTLEKPGPMMASKQKLIALATRTQPSTDALKEASTYVSQSHRSNMQQKLIRAATGTRPQDLSEHEESVTLEKPGPMMASKQRLISLATRVSAAPPDDDDEEEAVALQSTDKALQDLAKEINAQLHDMEKLAQITQI